MPRSLERREPARRADVVLVCPNLGDGGTQRVVTTLANTWSRSGKSVCVVTVYDGQGPDCYALDPSVRRISLLGLNALPRGLLLLGRILPQKVRELLGWMFWTSLRHLPRQKGWLHIWLTTRRLRRAIAVENPRVVAAFIASSNIATVLACRGTGRRVVISERNDPARQQLDYPWSKLRPRHYNGADVVTANSRGSLTAMEGYVDKRKLVYVPNPLVRPAEPSPIPAALSARRPFLLTVGRLHAQKAYDVLLQAFARSRPATASWRLAMVGQGELEAELKAEAARLRIGERVDWYGQIDDPFPYYEAADVFVLASRHEGAPNALMEAMSCGLAVIVSDASPGPLELVRDDESGIVVPVDDVEALAGAIVRLVSDRALRARLGDAARARAAEFEPSKTIAAWTRLLGL